MCVFISRNDRIDGQKLFKEKDGSFIRLSAGWGSSYFKWSFPKTDQVVLVLFFFWNMYPEVKTCYAGFSLILVWPDRRSASGTMIDRFIPCGLAGNNQQHILSASWHPEKNKSLSDSPPPQYLTMCTERSNVHNCNHAKAEEKCGCGFCEAIPDKRQPCIIIHTVSDVIVCLHSCFRKLVSVSFPMPLRRSWKKARTNWFGVVGLYRYGRVVNRYF